MWLERDNPARYVAAFNSQSDMAKRLAKFGYASLQATSKLVQQLYAGAESRAAVEGLKLPTISLLHTALHDQCPLRDQAPSCPETSRYRTADGRCNNPAHPWWGASMMPLHRFLPPNYRDGLERVRMSVSGGPLPSARSVSTAIHSDRDNDLNTITHMVMQWGQFLDHDLTSSAQTRGFNGSVPKCCIDGGRDFQPIELTHPDCMAIPVPPDDWFYKHYGIRCLEFVRSSPTSRVGCSLGPRDQINQVTVFIDASAVYGSSQDEEDNLRMFRNGLLKYSRVQYRLPLLPAATHKADLCRGQAGHLRCFHAGDKRVNEQPGLIALHTIWLRAHNKIATELSHINPHWRDEKLYQETRRIIGAFMQHITFKEFLPIVLGHDVMKLFDLELMRKGYFKGYDIKTNPTAANAFGTAAFRFGHSLVQHSLMRCDRSHRKLHTNVSLHEELTNPSNLYNIGSVDRLLLGLCQQPAQKRDEFITIELTNRLFQTPSYRYGMDLAALNIQRGRDHGLAPYNAWREPCGLEPFTDWPQLLKVMSAETQRRLKRVYRDVDDIDLFPGAMAERPVSGGLVGPTFACILAQQFSNLRKGDRFWYENGGFESSFTLAQLQQIRRITLARILCDNLDGIDTLQPFVFLTVDEDRNYRVPCDSDYIPHFDLKPWTESHKEETFHEEPPDQQHSPSHQKPSYPTYEKPPKKPTPSYHHTTQSSFEEHKPSYLIDFESGQTKPSYLIDNNFQGKPTKPQNTYTTSKYPKPQEEHKPTYLIEENFQLTRPTSKRPYGGYKPSDSAELPLEHKGTNHHTQDQKYGSDHPNKDSDGHHHSLNHHNHHHLPQGEGPYTPEPYEEHDTHNKYPSHHHEQHNSHDSYQPVHKPQGHPVHNQKPHTERPNYSKPYYEYTTSSKPYHELPNDSKPHTGTVYTTHSRPYDEHPSHSKPHYEYTTHSKPHGEYPSHSKPHGEYPSHSKPNYEYSTHSKPHDEYPSYSKPHYEYTTHSKPYNEYPSSSNPHSKPYVEYPSHSKPHYGYTTQSKPYDKYPSTSKPHYEYTTHTKPYGEYPSYSKPYYEYTTHFTQSATHQTKPYDEHTTRYYKPQYIYTLNIPHATPSSKPHYEYTHFTESSHNDVPSTLDYNKYKPRPTKPGNYHEGSYIYPTKPPHKEHHSGNYPEERPSYQRPFSSGYHHASYSYIKLFNEPSYYYLDDGEKGLVNATRNRIKETSKSSIHTEEEKSSILQSDNFSLELEPRTSLNEEIILTDIDHSNIDISHTADISVNNASIDKVTIDGNTVNIIKTPEEKKNIIDIAENTNGNTAASNISDVPDDKEHINESEMTITEKMLTVSTISGSGIKISAPGLSNITDISLNSDTSMSTVSNFTATSDDDLISSTNEDHKATDATNTNSDITKRVGNDKMNSTLTKHNTTLTHNTVTSNTNSKMPTNTTSKYMQSSTTSSNTDDDIIIPNSTQESITNSMVTVTNTYSTASEQVVTLTTVTEEEMDLDTFFETSTASTEQSNRVTTLTESEFQFNTEFTEETSAESDSTTVYSTVSDITSTEPFLISSSSADSDDDWIFTEEEEDDATFIPEMPSIESDPMALKELPRPMVFEDDETSRHLM
ncbi:uncharacterized protein [Periplaneta americana]